VHWAIADYGQVLRSEASWLIGSGQFEWP